MLYYLGNVEVNKHIKNLVDELSLHSEDYSEDRVQRSLSKLRSKIVELRDDSEQRKIDEKNKVENEEKRKKRDEELIKIYNESSKKLKRYVKMWFGKKYDFGTYLDDFTFEINTVISNKFNQLVKEKDYYDIDQRLEFFRLRNELKYRFKIGIKLRNKADKVEKKLQKKNACGKLKTPLE